MSFFDEYENDWNNDFGAEKPDPDAEIIASTLEIGQFLLNMDYLPMLQDRLDARFKQYLVGKKHLNLYQHGWRIQFAKSKQWAGLCAMKDTQGESKNGRNIYISIDFVRHDKNWKQNGKDTIEHEISHAIVDELFWNNYGELLRIDMQHKITKGHGIVWSAVCAAISIDNKNRICAMYYDNDDFKDSFKNYKYKCLFCGHVEYGETSSFAETCSNCMKPVFIEPNK